MKQSSSQTFVKIILLLTLFFWLDAAGQWVRRRYINWYNNNTTNNNNNNNNNNNINNNNINNNNKDIKDIVKDIIFGALYKSSSR